MKTLICRLKEEGRYELSVLLFVMSVACFLLSFLRCLITGSSLYIFLNWNLFLAAVPWIISSLVMLRSREVQPLWLTGAVLFAWLLFFPNSPYILTDMFHLRYRGGAPLWFDLVLILSFAWTGLVFGFVSLFDVEYILSRHLNSRQVFLLVTILLFVACFGVYMGRYLRWNSWDILTDPQSLLADITDRFANPANHSRTWGLTILMGAMLNFMYRTLRLIQRKNITGHRNIY